MTENNGNNIANKTPLKIILITLVAVVIIISVCYIAFNSKQNNAIIGEWTLDVEYYIQNYTEVNDFFDFGYIQFDDDGTGSFTISANITEFKWSLADDVQQPGIWINEIISGHSTLYLYQFDDNENTLILVTPTDLEMHFIRM